MVCGGCPVRAGLEEVGAHRSADEIEELPQNAVLVEARNCGKRPFDALPDGLLGGLPRLDVQLARRIEAQVKQLQQVARDTRMPVEGVGDVARAERRAELAQEGGIGPQRRRGAPVGAGRDDQAIEAVVVGLPVEDRKKCGLQALVVGAEFDGRAVGGLEHHVVQRDLAHAVGKDRADVIGALVDGDKAHVLEQGHALRQVDGAAEAIDGGAEAMRRRVGLAIEIDGDRQIRPEPLDARDVFERALGGEGFRVARREGRPVFRQQRAGTRTRCRDGVRQPSCPGAQDFD